MAEDVVAFLDRHFRERGPDRVTTSISEIFLVGDEVFKLKRPVSLPYVDFSTLEKRRIACEREVALNRQTAPALYKGVVAVTRQGEGLTLGGPGEAVDYLVHMRRFGKEALFSHMADKGILEERHVLALADRIARFHEGLAPAPGFGGAAAMRRAVQSVVEGSAGTAWHGDIAALGDRWQERLAPLAERLDIRARRGYVRRCHGDLHLGNICLFEGEPVLFDCIEFNDDIASVDIAYDAAFPVADLLARGRPELAGLLLNRYLGASGDYQALALWPLFLAARAIVRASVRALEGAGPEPYLASAGALLAPVPPRLIAVGGRSGSGKSTLARHLSPLLPPAGAVWLRSDVIRKSLFGKAPEERLPESAYAREVTEHTYRRLMRMAGRALHAGWPVVLDAVFLAAAERQEAQALARRAGVPFQGLWLDAPLAMRAARSDTRRGDASDATAEIVHRQETIDAGEIGWPVLETGRDIAQTVATARERLGL
jgi:aminoglycoside phosphotransferase family enzyme/predicted kinase